MIDLDTHTHTHTHTHILLLAAAAPPPEGGKGGGQLSELPAAPATGGVSAPSVGPDRRLGYQASTGLAEFSTAARALPALAAGRPGLRRRRPGSAPILPNDKRARCLGGRGRGARPLSHVCQRRSKRFPTKIGTKGCRFQICRWPVLGDPRRREWTTCGLSFSFENELAEWGESFLEGCLGDRHFTTDSTAQSAAMAQVKAGLGAHDPAPRPPLTTTSLALFGGRRQGCGMPRRGQDQGGVEPPRATPRERVSWPPPR